MRKLLFAAAVITHFGGPSFAEEASEGTPHISNDFQEAHNWSCAVLVSPNMVSGFTQQQVFFDYYLGLIGCELAKAERDQPNASEQITRAFQHFINSTYLNMEVESDLDEDGILGPMTAQAAIELARDIEYHTMFLSFDHNAATKDEVYRHQTISELFKFSPDTYNANIDWAKSVQDYIDQQDYFELLMEQYRNSPACENTALNPYYQGPCFYEASFQLETKVPAPNAAAYDI